MAYIEYLSHLIFICFIYERTVMNDWHGRFFLLWAKGTFNINKNNNDAY